MEKDGRDGSKPKASGGTQASTAQPATFNKMPQAPLNLVPNPEVTHLDTSATRACGRIQGNTLPQPADKCEAIDEEVMIILPPTANLQPVERNPTKDLFSVDMTLADRASSHPPAVSLGLHRLAQSVQPPSPPQPQFLEDLIYYRYGYCLEEEPYQGPSPAFAESHNPFELWVNLCHAVGGQGLSSSVTNHAPIADFLVALLCSERPFQEVPGKYWDLSPESREPLKFFSPIHLRIDVKKFQSGSTLCLLRSSPSLPPTTNWYIAVEPMTSLECIRQSLGPSLIDIAEFLIKNGIPFRTLAPSSQLPIANVPATSSRQFLGYRPYQYKFDPADFAAYEILRDSFLLAQPQGRRALCYGGIVARLAREILPDSVVLAGPSYSALQGQQETLHDGGDLFVDDQLSDRDLDLICGTYEVETSERNQTASLSWFPKANIWEASGYNVGHWNQDCEKFYFNRRTEILAGTGVPLTSRQWRRKVRMNRQAPKLIVQINKAALSFLQSSEGDSLTHCHPEPDTTICTLSAIS